MTQKTNTSNIPLSENMGNFLKMIQISGSCTETQARKFLNESELRAVKESGIFNFSSISCKRKTLGVFHEKGIITEDEYNQAYKSQIPQVGVMTVNPAGRRFMERKFGLKDVHSCNGKHHDLVIAAKFISLDDDERASCKPEGEIRRELKKEIVTMRREDREGYDQLRDEYEAELKGFCDRFDKQCNYGSPVDLAYRSSSTGCYVGYEVTTNSYSEFDKAVKSFSCGVMQYGYEEEGI